MAVTINGVAEKSRAQRVGIQPGDVLVAINGHEIIDVLDYRFFETERELRLSCGGAGRATRWSWSSPNTPSWAWSLRRI